MTATGVSGPGGDPTHPTRRTAPRALLRLLRISASQVHYALCALATLKLIFERPFDGGFGAWVIAFWTTGIANDKFNTRDPNEK